MPFQLHVRVGDRVQRFTLEPGDTVVGSSGECSICVPNPTVSRRHARLSVTTDGVSITDLGSSNGTRVDKKPIDAECSISPGKRLLLGSVEVWLEEVDHEDVEIAVNLPPATAPDTRPSLNDVSHSPVSTVGPAALQEFSLGELPGLVDRLTAREGPIEMAQSVGESMWRTMPCRMVEILRQGNGDAAVLFRANRGGGNDEGSVREVAGRDIEVRVTFLSPALANIYRPLVRVTAGLISVAGIDRFASESASPNPSTTPRPPDPPSVVAEVRDLYAQAARVARGRVSVLICGESGTGKELFARYIHAASERAAAPLVTLNCAALPRDLLESELFGVERGVATGVDARAGKFEAAHGGTLFLDEIGDMAPETQARILRVLQEGEVFRIGGHDARPADVRVISATNRDLNAMLDDGRFRSDLYHRIADWVVELPPLRRRCADVANLAAHFLARSCAERGVNAAGISRAAVKALESFDWPGNVRQLEKEMGRAALFLEDGDVLASSQLQPAIAEARDSGAGDSLKEVVEAAERAHIERILGECGGVVTTAAERLEIGSSTLYRRLKELGIE